MANQGNFTARPPDTNLCSVGIQRVLDIEQFCWIILEVFLYNTGVRSRFCAEDR